jgi:hypothetical protein
MFDKFPNLPYPYPMSAKETSPKNTAKNDPKNATKSKVTELP